MFRLIIFFFLVSFSFFCQPVFGNEQTINLEIQRLIEEGNLSKYYKSNLMHKFVKKELSELYSQHSFSPFWIDSEVPSKKATILQSVLEASKKEGLEPNDYNVKMIAALWESSDMQDQARLDVMLTLSLVNYVLDARYGRIFSSDTDHNQFMSLRSISISPTNILNDALSASNFNLYLKQASPQHKFYQSLKKALKHYRQIQDLGGWKEIPLGPTIKPGTEDTRVLLVQQRLKTTGDLSSSLEGSENYIKEYQEAVKKFQLRHNLPADGNIGSLTQEAMNIPVEEKIKQIVLNLERWRWITNDLSAIHLFINLTSNNLFVTRDSEVELLLPVQVGTAHAMTPIFSGQLDAIEIKPYWYIPHDISANEYLPDLRRDPLALRKKHIRIFVGWSDDSIEVDPKSVKWNKVSQLGMKRYQMRQDPGTWNELGTIKFMSTNDYDLYLHDTPRSQSYYERNQKSFRNGSIRVDKPYQLAAYLLGGKENNWDTKRIRSLINHDKRKVISLEQPVPMHVLYNTVSAHGGVVKFYPDLRGHDHLLNKTLFK